MGDMVLITESLLNQGRTPRGGYTRRQLALLGEDWPPARGWKARLIGRTISTDNARAFLEPALVPQKEPLDHLDGYRKPSTHPPAP